MLSKPLFKLKQLPSLYKTLFFKFSNDFKEPASQLPNIEKAYDIQRISRINDPKFIVEIMRQEELELKAKNYRFSMKTFKYPLLLIFLMGFLFHCWFTVPYKVVFKHVTINDRFSNQLTYSYSWLFAPLSIRNTQDFVIYFLIFSHALFILNKFLKPRQIIAFYLINGLIFLKSFQNSF